MHDVPPDAPELISGLAATKAGATRSTVDRVGALLRRRVGQGGERGTAHALQLGGVEELQPGRGLLVLGPPYSSLARSVQAIACRGSPAMACAQARLACSIATARAAGALGVPQPT